jgi:hypothetical protein
MNRRFVFATASSVEGPRHWPQHEKPADTLALLLSLLKWVG